MRRGDIVTVAPSGDQRRAKVGPVIGRVSAARAGALNAALAFALGLAD